MKLEDKTIKADTKGFQGGEMDLYQREYRKVQDMKKTGIILLAVVLGLVIYVEVQVIALLDILSEITIIR